MKEKNYGNYYMQFEPLGSGPVSQGRTSIYPDRGEGDEDRYAADRVGINAGLERGTEGANFRRFLLLAGCRRSEALQITYKDINWQQRRIDIGLTKNGEPKFIFITDDITKVIREIPAEVGELFPWKPDSVTHHFERNARAGGLKCRLHDLRHTYGFWLAMAGVKIQVIKDLMGHQGIKTTMIYAHLSQAHLEEAAGKMKISEGE
jgi:integrase